MKTATAEQQLLSRIRELEQRLEESEQLIDAIKAGEVDAFAITNDNIPAVYTLQSADYAYRVLIEDFGEGAIHVADDGLIVYSNPYFCELLKIPYEKVIGSSIFDFVHPDTQPEFAALFKKSLAGKSKGEISLRSGDTLIPVYVSLTSLQPKLPTVGIIITDFTEKKKNERIILEYQKNLEKSNVELLQSNSALASFAYVASHDLQEPLRKIQTFATRIIDREMANLSETGKDHLKRMQISAKRMQTLIEDLLTYSRTNTEDHNLEKTDLKLIVDDVTKDLEEELKLKHASIEASVLCKAVIIPFQFRQLLYNLISNSLKFSDPRKPLQIKIKSEIANGLELKNEKLSGTEEYCHISFSDNGIGFENQYNEKIFELFQRLHGKSEYLGTGIGLAIVKKVVENHHGFVTAHGELNKGATFDIYLPAKPSM